MPSWGDEVPGSSLAFSRKSVRRKGGEGTSFFEEASRKGLLIVAAVAVAFVAALISVLRR